MMFGKPFVLYSVLLSSSIVLTGCLDDDDHNETAAAVCIDSAKQVTLSDKRTLCVTLNAFKAEAPFVAGFKAPGKVVHTVFISDSDGNPVNVETDSVVSAIAQYPMMYMETGHSHSAPFMNADTSAAEYGAYNFEVFYPMATADMNGNVMGKWEYRVKITDNMGTTVSTDDEVHTVKFEPTAAINMSTKAFRAVAKHETDKFKNPMDVATVRQYTAWLNSVSQVAAGTASVSLYLTTQDMHHEATGSMSKPSARSDDHTHTMDATDAGSDEDKISYPPVHAPMTVEGTEMKLTLHSEDGTTEVDVATVKVEVSVDNGDNWTELTGGMTHHTMGYYSGDVTMAAGDITMLVRTTVNDNIMTKTGVVADGTDADDLPALKFTATAAE